MTKRKTAPDRNGDLDQHASQQPIRLLVHAVDGVVPYLTPESLRKCFPAASSNRLLLGLAVRDTCVVPVYPQGKNRPRGYTFSSSCPADAWLQEYNRVTVPSFDLVDDETDKNDSGFTVNNNHVMTWTPNGRLALTPQLFLEASQGLAAHITLPLYDMIPPPGIGSSDSKRTTRARAAITRSREWFRHWMVNQKDNAGAAWVPLLVDPMAGIDFEYQLDFIRSAASDGRVEGVVLIGLAHVQGEALAQKALSSVREKLGDLQLGVVVLTTHSLRQFLLVATHGGSVIGSDLAAKLAHSYKALVVDISQSHAHGSDNKGAKRSRPMVGTMGLDRNGCVDLTPPNNDANAHAWFSDMSPMVDGCSCFTCKTHSRSYIYHLVCAKELLANMLLMIHNLHHMIQLLKVVEDATAREEPELLYQRICAQLGDAESQTN